MNWLERHLNWSLFFGTFLLPLCVGLVFTGIWLAVLWGQLAPYIVPGGEGFSPEVLTSTIYQNVPLIIIGSLISLAMSIFGLIVMWWYLGQKARSKWFMLLYLVPVVLSAISRAASSSTDLSTKLFSVIFGILTLVVGLIDMIIFYCLENRAIGIGGDFAAEAVADRWPDSGQYGAIDDPQYKELDYTPTQNVLDISGGGPARDISHTSDVSEAVDSGAVKAGGEEAPEPEKVVQRSVSQQILQMPILLDDGGAPISCFYHPGADAVNMCSRCRKYVCAQCNYITGTHPICHSCWDKRALFPVAPPEQKQVKTAPAKRVKQKGKISVEPEKHKVAEVAQVEAQKITEPAVLEKQQVIEPTAPVSAPAEPIEQKYVEPMKPEPQKIVVPAKAVKQEAEKIEWQQEFMALYEQASPIINAVTSKSPDGMPASPLDLMEGLKLRPMLELVKKLSKPKDKELRDAKSDLEKLMSNCIKIADAAANFISSGGQALLGGPDFKRIVDGIETANGLLEKLSRRLAAFSRPQG